MPKPSFQPQVLKNDIYGFPQPVKALDIVNKKLGFLLWEMGVGGTFTESVHFIKEVYVAGGSQQGSWQVLRGVSEEVAAERILV